MFCQRLEVPGRTETAKRPLYQRHIHAFRRDQLVTGRKRITHTRLAQGQPPYQLIISTADFLCSNTAVHKLRILTDVIHQCVHLLRRKRHQRAALNRNHSKPDQLVNSNSRSTAKYFCDTELINTNKSTTGTKVRSEKFI